MNRLERTEKERKRKENKGVWSGLHYLFDNAAVQVPLSSRSIKNLLTIGEIGIFQK